MRRYTRVKSGRATARIQSVIQESSNTRTVIKTLEQADRHIGKLGMICKTHSVVRYSVVPRFSLGVLGGILVFRRLILQPFGGAKIRLSTAGSITFGTIHRLPAIGRKIGTTCPRSFIRLLLLLYQCLTAVVATDGTGRTSLPI